MPNAFTMVFTLGVLVNFLWLGLSEPTRTATSRLPDEKTSPTTRIDAGLSALTAGLIGARAGFVLLHWGYYASRLIETFWFWQGGLSWIGGVVGAVIGLGVYTTLSHRPFWPLADILALSGVVMALSSWTGCLLEGCAYGRRTNAGFWTPLAVDMFGSRVPRWPTQTVGIVLNLVILAVLYWLAGRHLRHGTLVCMSLSLIAASSLALTFTRGDPVLLLAGLRLDTVGTAVILLLALCSLVLCNLRR